MVKVVCGNFGIALLTP
ncbi:DUF3265 domain-containing protein [Vibrio parahaemolyticus]|nr:DUF3265 domain-containing protein [Vibrio parahaemolyticus]